MVSPQMPVAPKGHHWATILHDDEVEVQLVRTQDLVVVADAFVEYVVMGRTYNAVNAVIRGANKITHRVQMAQQVFDELGVIATTK